MKIRVLIRGYGSLGKRLADAVQRQPDMEVAAVVERAPARFQMSVAKGFRTVRGDPLPPGVQADAVVWTETRTVSAAEWNGASRDADGEFSCMSVLSEPDEVRRPLAVKIGSASALALARLCDALRPLGRIERWCATVIVRAGHATSPQSGCVDALRPIFSEGDDDIRAILGRESGTVHLRRVVAPYTHSCLHLLKVDFTAAPDRARALTCLKSGPRILVGQAAAGFKSTAHLQEFCRDSGRSRGDRPELFIWEESVETIGNSLCLMMDVEPDAALVPECIDAIRLRANRQVSMLQSIQQTDAALGLGLWPQAVVPLAYA